MKKITLRIISLAVVMLFSASAMQAQTSEEVEWHKNGYYTIGIPGENLFITINASSGALEWAAALTGADLALQQWAIVDHITPSSGGLMQITAEYPGVATWTMATANEDPGPEATTAEKRDLTLIARPGNPIAVTPLNDDYSGKDQFQRRKTSTNLGNNDALFLRTPWDTGSRFGVAPTAAGDPVKFDNGAIDKLEFVIQARELPLSVNNFDASSIFVSNPVNSQLSIKGLTPNVKQVSLYSLLGKELLTRNVESQSAINIDMSALSSGMYLVKMQGDNGSFSKKIVKQ